MAGRLERDKESRAVHVLCKKCGNTFLSSAKQYKTTLKLGICPECRQ